jgi:hypothetical protein
VSDLKWQVILSREDIPYVIRGLPPNLAAVWSRFEFDRQLNVSDEAILHGDKIKMLRDAVDELRRGNKSGESLIGLGTRLARKDKALEERLKGEENKGEGSKRAAGSSTIQPGRPHVPLVEILTESDTGPTPAEGHADIVLPDLEYPQEEGVEFTAEVVHSLCPKLNWILNDVK